VKLLDHGQSDDNGKPGPCAPVRLNRDLRKGVNSFAPNALSISLSSAVVGLEPSEFRCTFSGVRCQNRSFIAYIVDALVLGQAHLDTLERGSVLTLELGIGKPGLLVEVKVFVAEGLGGVMLVVREIGR